MLIEGKQVVNPFGETTTVGYCNLKNVGKLKLKNTVTGTFSIYLKCGTTGSVSVGSNKKVISSEWSRYIFYDVPIDGEVEFGEGEYYLYDAKFESGSKATSYTPAPEDDPIMYDNVIYDTSGYGNNGSVADSTCPTWNDNSPRYKGCYKFNGSNQYINCGTSSMIQGQTELTVNVWAYMDDWTKFDSRLFSCTEGGGYNTEFYNNSLYFACNVYTKSDKSAYAYNSQTGGYPRIPLSNIKSGWHMFTCVYNAAVGDSIYLDGKLYEQKKYTSYGVHYNNAPLFLGAEAGNNANYPTSPYFNGKLSDFRIYSTALSDADILDLYQSSGAIDSNGNLLINEVIEE